MALSQCYLLTTVVVVIILLTQVLHFLYSYKESITTFKALPQPVSLQSVLNQTYDGKLFKILFWTRSYHDDHREWFGVGHEPFQRCKYCNCYTTNQMKDITTSDAILFHMIFTSIHKMPSYRKADQIWIMHTGESPAPRTDFRKYDGLFNATWTYDRTSDIWTNYSHRSAGGLFVKRNNPEYNLLETDYSKQKQKLVVWLVSHCDTESKRMEYVQHLKKFVDIDIFGSCTKSPCGHRKQSMECDKYIRDRYKFYLAFENKLCVDYVTEKIWRAINYDMVPIVLGAYNYSELLPPGSYIDIKDFASPMKLAEYLIQIDQDNSLYNAFFSWKAYYTIMKHPPYPCTLCEYLNKAENISKTYYHLGEFWNYTNKCYSPEQFYPNIIKTAWQAPI